MKLVIIVIVKKYKEIVVYLNLGLYLEHKLQWFIIPESNWGRKSHMT